MFVHLHFSNMGVSLVLVSRGQTLFFAQERYRFQYKRPCAKNRVWPRETTLVLNVVCFKRL